MDLEEEITIVDAKNVHLWKAHEDLAHSCRVLLDRSAKPCLVSHPVRLTAPPPLEGDAVPLSDPKNRK